MTRAFVIAATDTDVGKTVFAAALVRALDGHYWKPVQAGAAPEIDSETVARLSGLPRERILPEAYRLNTAASPHIAAARDAVEIDPDRLRVLPRERPLVVEVAGGLMVPLTNSLLQIDVLTGWNAPVILCARTALGTINHSLLSLEALRARDARVHGVVFIGDAKEDVEATIASLGKVRMLGRLPFIAPLDDATLANAFSTHFNVADFLA